MRDEIADLFFGCHYPVDRIKVDGEFLESKIELGPAGLIDLFFSILLLLFRFPPPLGLLAALAGHVGELQVVDVGRMSHEPVHLS